VIDTWHRSLWPSYRGKVFLPLSLEFEPQHTCLSPSQCLACLLGLQGIQLVRGLVVVRVSWPGHPGLPKKKSDRYMTHNTILHRSYRANYSQIHTICFLIFPRMLQWQKRNKNDYEIYVYLRTCLHEYKILGPKYTRTLVCDEPCIERLRCSLLFSQGLASMIKIFTFQ
jgi:hypothetical protein